MLETARRFKSSPLLPMKKIHTDEGVYQYQVGRQNVLLFDPKGTKSVIPLSDISGLSWDQIERGKWKRWFSVTPSMVRDFIWRVSGRSRTPS
jgi:hypothetical protein